MTLGPIGDNANKASRHLLEPVDLRRRYLRLRAESSSGLVLNNGEDGWEKTHDAGSQKRRALRVLVDLIALNRQPAEPSGTALRRGGTYRRPWICGGLLFVAGSTAWVGALFFLAWQVL